MAWFSADQEEKISAPLNEMNFAIENRLTQEEEPPHAIIQAVIVKYAES